MTSLTPLKRLAMLGQSIWYDNIDRALLDTGGLKELVARGIRGVTSNPSIFHKAISESTAYDATIAEHALQGRTSLEIYERLALDDIGRAADQLLPVFRQTEGRDGFASLEVNPALADDCPGTIAEARRLFRLLGRPNVLIKVPATVEGAKAVEALIAEGINVNVTLIFSLSQYERAAEAYMRGLERRRGSSKSLRTVASVASLFVSRVDGVVDQAVDRLGERGLQGTIAIANAKVAYERFRQIFSGPRWNVLAAEGAQVQRPLWASTGTKNPAYPDTLYVDSLIGQHTVNTVPPSTLDAFLDHGCVAETVTTEMIDAYRRLQQLAKMGVRLDDLTRTLQLEGITAFTRAFDRLLEVITIKASRSRG